MAENDNDKQQEVVYADEEENNGMYRWMSAFVVLLAVVGFFGLAWYAYKSGGDSTMDDHDLETVKADSAPVKEAPANPGGMQIPNQDKTVYGLIGNGKVEKPMVERVMPAPETPVDRNGDTEIWMSDSAKNKSGGTQLNPSPAEPETPTTQFKPQVQAQMKPAAPITPPAPVTLTPQNPPLFKTVVVPKKEAPKAPAPAASVPLKVEKETEEAPASSSPPSGMRAQLGAFKSQAEADSNWKRISKKFSKQIGDREHYVVRAQVAGKGTFYRLQVAPFDSARDTDSFCHALSAQGQGCFPAKGK